MSANAAGEGFEAGFRDEDVDEAQDEFAGVAAEVGAASEGVAERFFGWAERSSWGAVMSR